MTKKESVKIQIIFFRDSRLSYKARGILAYLLTLDGNYFNISDLLGSGKHDKLTSVRSGLKELQQLKYIRLRPKPRKQKNLFDGMCYELTLKDRIPFDGDDLAFSTRNKFPYIRKEYRYIPYQEQYKHANWKNIRKYIFMRDDYKCVECGSTGKLNVHHEFYNGYIWDVPLDSLKTLCVECHKEKHPHLQ